MFRNFSTGLHLDKWFTEVLRPKLYRSIWAIVDTGYGFTGC